jgi:hypothetical protein
MNTVHFSPNFVLAAVNMEMTKANKASAELYRLMNIGYMYSQMGLDVAKDVKTHLTKAYELLELVNTPDAKEAQFAIGGTIARQDMIIRTIEMSL